MVGFTNTEIDSINYRIRSDLNDPHIEILTIEIVKKNVKPF